MLSVRVLLLLSFSVGLSIQSEPPGGYYTTRYDHIDVENILNQKRLVYYYAECLLDRGPCTPQGIEFKRILPEALKTNCLRCTEKQRFVTLKSIRRLKKEYPDVWAQLAEIWDPTGEYVQNLENSMNKYNNRLPDRSADVDNLIPALPTSTQRPHVVTRQTTATTSRTTPSTSRTTSPTTSKTTESSPSTTSRASTTKRLISTTKLASPTKITLSLSSTKHATVYTTANKPISFVTINLPTTSPNTLIVEQSTAHTTHIPTRKRYNYDFSMTNKPPIQRKITGINLVIQGVNNIIQPISDIAGRVITAGTDIAGIVLNAIGIRKTT